jgi:glyoxylase-like metal-dependent hydrolase (beta-lactamase superfamily II)
MQKHIVKLIALLAVAITAVALVLLISLSIDTPAAAESNDTSRIRAVLGNEPPPSYEIHAIHLGSTKDAHRNLFIADPSLPKRIPVAFSLWVIVGGGRTILVDTGFTNRNMIDQWRIQDYRHPVNALSDAGFEKEQITDLVITHGHWDHIGGLHLFEPPRVWINKKVFGKLNKLGGVHQLLRKANHSGRLNVTKEIQAIAPGIAVVPVGLHAPGFQYVVVKTPNGIWVLASDIAPLFANFTRRIPTGQTESPEKTLEIQQTILALTGGDVHRIIPGHEPGVYKNGKRHMVFGP